MDLMRVGERIVGGVKNLSGRAENAVKEASTKLKTTVKSGTRAVTDADEKLTSKQEKQLVGRLDYLHLLHPTRVPRPAGSEVAHINEPNLQEAVTIGVSPETWRQREEFIKRLKDKLHTGDGEAPAAVITDSEQKQIDKLIADIKHPTEVKEAPELKPEAPGTSTGTTKAPQSGGGYNPAKFMEKAKDNNLSRSEQYMYDRLGNMRANAQKVFDKGTDEQIKNELGRWGIETKDGDKVADYMNKIDEMLKEKAESGPTIGDKFRAHHGVGLTGLGVVGISTLDLASNRGQQSNAQLYSDPFA